MIEADETCETKIHFEEFSLDVLDALSCDWVVVSVFFFFLDCLCRLRYDGSEEIHHFRGTKPGAESVLPTAGGPPKGLMGKQVLRMVFRNFFFCSSGIRSVTV